MFIAGRDTKWISPSILRAGQWLFGHNTSIPDVHFTNGVLQIGQDVIISRILTSFLLSSTGSTTSGITSPALWITTKSPIRRSFSLMYDSL